MQSDHERRSIRGRRSCFTHTEPVTSKGFNSKRQSTAAVQNLSDLPSTHETPQGFGLRLCSAAFSAGLIDRHFQSSIAATLTIAFCQLYGLGASAALAISALQYA